MCPWSVIISVVASLSSIWWGSLKDVLKDLQKATTNDETKKAFIDFGKGRRKKQAFDRAFETAANELAKSSEIKPDLAKGLKKLLEMPDPQAKDFRREAVKVFFFSRDVDYAKLRDAFDQHLQFESLLKELPKAEGRFTKGELLSTFTEFMRLFRNAALDEAELRPILIDVEHHQSIKKIEEILDASRRGIDPLHVSTKKRLTDPQFEEYLTSYLKYVENETQRIKIIGFSHGRTDIVEPLVDELFVPLHAVVGMEGTPREEALRPDEERLVQEDLRLLKERRLEGEKRVAKRIKLNDAVRDNSRLVILGDPGSGKTTMLRYIAYLCVKGQGVDTFGFSAERIPVYIECRTFNKNRQQKGPGFGLIDYLYETVRESRTGEVPVEFYEKLFTQREFILLFDGLDEVTEEASRFYIRHVVEQLVSEHEAAPCIVTSRITGYGSARLNPQKFEHLTLLSFTDEDIFQFVRNWYCCVEQIPEAEIGERADLLVERIQQTPGTKRLAINPLMLTIICTIHRTETLPNQRHKLYDKAVESLLYKWDAVRGLGDSFIREEEKKRRLEYLAEWMHTDPDVQEARGEVSRRELHVRLAKHLRERGTVSLDDEAAKFIDHIKERTGLLVERGTDRFAFYHLTFEEYFVASKIVYDFENEMDFGIIESMIKDHLHDPAWEEVILLVLANLKPKPASRAVQCIIETNSPFNDLLQHDWLFAFRVLGDDVALEAECWQRIITHVGDLAKNPEWGALRQRVFETSRFLNGTRYSRSFSPILLELARTAKSQHVRKSAALALGELGEKTEAAGLLLELARTAKDEHMRQYAAQALGELGEKTEAAGLLLELARTGKDELVRQSAAEALGELGEKTEVVIGGLLELARTAKDELVRGFVVVALGELGEKTEAVIGGLLELARTGKDELVRGFAAAALGKLGEKTEAAGLLLELARTAKDEHMRQYAAQALGQLGGKTEAAGLLSELARTAVDESVCVFAAQALGELGAKTEAAGLLLELARTAKKENVRRSAAEALGELGEKTEAAGLLLELARTAKDEHMRQYAAQALGELGEKTEAAGLLLELARTGKDELVRQSAAEALGELGEKTEAVMEGLPQIIRDRNERQWVRNSAYTALQELVLG